MDNGNVYYRWPSFIPKIGIVFREIPMNNFSISLKDYDAYDVNRLQFMVDVTAFFQVDDPLTAAKRIPDFKVMPEDIFGIVQGAARRVLAAYEINVIMTDRAQFGDKFTEEVANDLKSWGLRTVKNLELMDIRDAEGSRVVANIMAMKSSEIDRLSRIEVAENMRAAEEAEIEARRQVDISRQQAEQAVGERTAEKDKAVGIAQQLSRQEVLTQEKTTRERAMEVTRVDQVKQAEINMEAAIVAADEQREVAIRDADGKLEAAKREAEGVKVNGEAKGAADKAILMAPVDAQIALAEKIASLPEYQAYLLGIRAIEAQESVGKAQAAALTTADVKVITNTGSATEGLTDAMQLFSGKGGLQIGTMLEGLANTEQGRGVLDALKGLMNKGDTSSPSSSAGDVAAEKPATAPRKR
ncbi:MAG: hypothetical protein COY40_03295 [Alphaproteobacteria bacterium CG_4_10_14_0_8_um_filter_53_9]|nr:MAG: hypothetical protein COY40_03295 [Alphaproteobacteria bacterium CG_4_10_14_0_8_um_filter_53_9]